MNSFIPTPSYGLNRGLCDIYIYGIIVTATVKQYTTLLQQR